VARGGIVVIARVLLLLAVWAITLPALALEPMPFRDDAEKQRFQALVDELRCTVCQNQNLADSNAELAKDLRRKVFEMMQAGQSDEEIKQYLVDRYGDFVLYRPPMKPATWALWYGPGVVLLIGAILLARTLRRRAQNLPATAAAIEDDT
jgi:cytochrome c-type biogenesis protein CcmH